MNTTISADPPDMHRTETVDFIYVAEGGCELYLENGLVALEAGDVVVQSGTMHAWRNPRAMPCRLIIVLIGADQTVRNPGI